MEKIILHIDFDSFFASVEEQYNPKLRGKPFGVTAANSRTCIIASSKVAKRLGISTGSRSFEALKIYPDFQLVSANFNRYWEVSKKFIAICKDYSPYVEVFSIDELFIDITKTHNLFGGVCCLIEKIKYRIRKEIGDYITVSIGISHNKLLAKLASGLRKPNGIMEIKKEDIEAVYKTVKLTDICGIGERINKRLINMGIRKLLDLRTIPFTYLKAEFGNMEALFLKNVAFGIDSSPVIPYTNPTSVKSVGRNYCLPKNEYDKRTVLKNVYELCEEVGIKLRRLNKKGRTLGFSLRGSFVLDIRKTTNHYFNSGKEIFNFFLYLFHKEYPSRKIFLPKDYVRQISIWVSNLEDAGVLPLSLFDMDLKKNRLQQTIDKINERFGDHTIRNGFLLDANKLTTVPNGFMADKYERFKLSQAETIP